MCWLSNDTELNGNQSGSCMALCKLTKTKENGERRRRLVPTNKRTGFELNTAKVADLQWWSYLHMSV